MTTLGMARHGWPQQFSAGRSAAWQGRDSTRRCHSWLGLAVHAWADLSKARLGRDSTEPGESGLSWAELGMAGHGRDSTRRGETCMSARSFLTIRLGRVRPVRCSCGGVPLSRTPNSPYVFRTATAPRGCRLRFGDGLPPVGGTAGDVCRVSSSRVLVSDGGNGQRCHAVGGPRIVNAVPRHFGVRGPMLYGPCPECGLRRKVVSSRLDATETTRAVKATRPWPLVSLAGVAS